jgi:2-methylisocitrate lyase-like PEP mutase family enzyme
MSTLPLSFPSTSMKSTGVRPSSVTTSIFIPATAFFFTQSAASFTAASIWPFFFQALSKCGDFAGILMYSTSAGTTASSQNCAILFMCWFLNPEKRHYPEIKTLRDLLATGKTIVAPGATDALSARLIEAAGFECAYIGSYATAASRFALPDSGLLSLDDLVEQARSIAGAVRVPVIADAEGGFNDPANMWRTVQAFERCGVAAIHIEDHSGSGKHTDAPQTLRPAEETAARIRAAVEARRDPDFVIVARSDAIWLSGDLEDCARRLQAYAEAGADLVFPTLADPAQLAEIRRRTGKPAMVVDMPGRPLADHKDAAIVLYYGFSALVQYGALKAALERFKAGGTLPQASFKQLEEFLGYGK